jgi:mono/diheme cytochrome c family protein
MKAAPWLLLLLLAGCERQFASMYRQARFEPGSGTPLFADGRAQRPPPAGSVPVAMGELAGTSSGRRGREEVTARAAAQAASAPPPLTRALLARGQDRYTVYCVPCHSPVGDGDGPVARRGFPHPPSYDEARLRTAPDRYFYDVISQGHGIMPSYADRVAPGDRWAIVAYVRALQLRMQAPVAELPAAVRERLDAGGTR